MFGFLFYFRWYFTQFHMSLITLHNQAHSFSQGYFITLWSGLIFFSKIILWGKKNEILGYKKKSSRHIQPDWKQNGISNYLQFALSNSPCRLSSEDNHLHSWDDFSIRTREWFWMTQCAMTTHWRAETWEISSWSKSEVVLNWGSSQLNIINV